MTSSDRQLLERAAKAAGIELRWLDNVKPGYFDGDASLWRDWNPLTSDGDALRLAVKLRMNVRFEDPASVRVGWAEGVHGAPTSDRRGPWFWVEWIDDNENTFAATRRAIVRAAASLGEHK